jgi:hypothetical protein
MSGGIECAEITADNVHEFELITSLFRKMRGVYVDSNFYTFLVRVYDLDDWKKMKRFSNAKIELVNVFYMALRAGKTQDGAKNEQLEYCGDRPEYLDAYNSIYS